MPRRKRRPSLDFSSPSPRRLERGLTTIPELALTVLPGKIFDKGPSVAVALGLCVGLSFAVGTLSGWYAYRSTETPALGGWGQSKLQGVADQTEEHAKLFNRSSLTFFDELRQPSKKEKMLLETQPPPRELVRNLHAAKPMNEGAPAEPSKEAVVPRSANPSTVAAADLGQVEAAPASQPVAPVGATSQASDRGEQMASALARLLGEPTSASAAGTGPSEDALNIKQKRKVTSGWSIKVSSMRTAEQAASLISHLASKGYKARISAGGATGSRHPVEIVGFADEDEAMDAQESLSREEGLSSVLLKP